MYRRNRKRKRSIHLGMIILILTFVAAGYKAMMLKSEEAEVVQVVKESDLDELSSKDNEKEAGKMSDTNVIRVLIMGNGYNGEVHPKVKLSSNSEMCLNTGGEKEYIDAGENLIIEPDDKRFENGIIRISSGKKIAVNSLERACGTPSYEGVLEFRTTAEGIVIINELTVEKYLKAVVPSEMPASYELEALKAQAVCARSYAYRQMEKFAYPEYQAHVNDSTDYQVYGNSKPQEKSNQAIKETKGEVLYYNDEIATAYYYSTSCGKTTDIRAWGTKKSEDNAYLKSVKVKGKNGDYEKNLPWYRWTAEIPVYILSDLAAINTGKDIGLLEKIEVTRRGGGDVAVEMKLTGEKGSVTVKTENKIRAALGGKGYQIVLNDGSVTDSRELLPSAFFTVEKAGDSFVFNGGGFGHGIGMSQNGANEMAKQGEDYKEILRLFYKDIEIR